MLPFPCNFSFFIIFPLCFSLIIWRRMLLLNIHTGCQFFFFFWRKTLLHIPFLILAVSSTKNIVKMTQFAKVTSKPLLQTSTQLLIIVPWRSLVTSFIFQARLSMSKFLFHSLSSCEALSEDDAWRILLAQKMLCDSGPLIKILIEWKRV